jgi:trigger factor
LAEKESQEESAAQAPSDETAESSPSPQPEADATERPASSAPEAAESPAAEAAPESEEGEEEKADEEEEKVDYELIEATARAGAIVDVKFKVAYGEYERKTAEMFKELRQNVIIDGFRRGKAPLRLIEKRYRKEVRQDAVDFLLGNCLLQIAKEKDYHALREFDRVDPEVAEGEDLEFAISLEVRPEIDPTGYDEFAFTIDTRQIDDAAVEAEIDKLRSRHATYQKVEVGGYEPKHAVALDIRVVDDKGNEIKELTGENEFFARPEASLPEEVANELRGKQAGESFRVELCNQRTSEGGVIISENDTYSIKVREVQRQVLPELDDEFARDMGGFDSVDALREEIRKTMEGNEERNVREQSLEKIYDALIERNPFDLPATMVGEVFERMVTEHEQRLGALGLRLEDLGDDPKDYVVRTQRNAERLLRVMLLNQAIAEKEKIEATDEDVNKAIERRAEEEGRRPLAIRARLEARKEMDRFRDDLKYDLVNDLLISRAKIDRQTVAAESKIVTRDKS